MSKTVFTESLNIKRETKRKLCFMTPHALWQPAQRKLLCIKFFNLSTNVQLGGWDMCLCVYVCVFSCTLTGNIIGWGGDINIETSTPDCI